MSPAFRAYGTLCAAYPCEIIVATFAAAVCFMTTTTLTTPPSSISPGTAASHHRSSFGAGGVTENSAADVTLMTLIRVLAVLYSCHQFRHLYARLKETKYDVLVIAGLFTVFSSLIFTSMVLNCLWIELSDLKDALFFFLLLTDLTKAAMLAEFALSSATSTEVRENIGRGISVLGPSMTLDTIVETLIIGVGALSGVHRLELLSYIACLSVIVNYVVFMTIYPACLALILELTKSKNSTKVHQRKPTNILIDQEQKSNPVVQRVKLIMSVGLTLVHLHSWWPNNDGNAFFLFSRYGFNRNKSDETTTLHAQILRFMTLSADHLVILILLLALVAKFLFYENFYDLPPTELRRLTYARQLSIRKKEDQGVQTECMPAKAITNGSIELTEEIQPKRSIDECHIIYLMGNLNLLTDDEICELIRYDKLQSYELEDNLDCLERAVGVRRKLLNMRALEDLPFTNYDYGRIKGACCENVIGYVPVPVGIAGPLMLDEGQPLYVPLATTEGCLVASTNRGCRAIAQSGGVRSRLVSDDGMTRGPVVRLPNIGRASELLQWLNSVDNDPAIRAKFEKGSRFVRLTRIHSRLAGRYVFIRFVATTGDAMGMNMLSKATEQALLHIRAQFKDMEIISISGNFCADKKPAAINWIQGRGKSVVCEALVPASVLQTTLKTNVDRLVGASFAKNLVGSTMSGCMPGGHNAHAANVVTAIFIATGQDPAQTVTSSNCMTLMEPAGDNAEDLLITCTMPSLEIGTIGGGTILGAQGACLEMLGIRGPHQTRPGDNARQLARVICATVLAGELSLMSALAEGHLVRSHLRHNRSTVAAASVETTNCD